MDPPAAPSTPPRRRLTRDQRRDVLLMRSLGFSYTKIADHLQISKAAVRYTVQKGQATPEHRNAGRPPKLNKTETDNLVEYVTSCHRTRCLSYFKLAEELYPEGEIGPESIKYALHKRGYRRRVALRKPPLSPQNQAARLEWAQQHVHWTEEQWKFILWSDETWVKAGSHRKTLVTRKPGEELDPTCIIDRIQRQSGWMFWGSFSGTTKGPCCFWEKDWGPINKESYCEKIVPLVDGWFRMNPGSGLLFMQDNAPSHAAKYTIQELQERGIPVILWPAFSPDLNPIETVWNKMKDWIGLNYPSRKATYDQLRQQVQEAWDAIGQETLQELIGTMHQRCLDVIEANGGHTRW